MITNRCPPNPRWPNAALAICGIVLAAGMGANAVLWVNIPPGHQHPYGLHLASPDIFRSLWYYPDLTLSASSFRSAGLALVVLQWVAYLVALAIAASQKCENSRQAIAIPIGSCAIITIFTALFFPTILSSDVYHYALQGRLFSVYNLNPYVATSALVQDDPFRSLSVWSDVTTQYGPTWTLLAAGLTALAGDDVPATVVAFKIVGAVSHLISTACIAWLGSKTPHVRPDVAAVLFGWNPTMIIESAGSGHNDALMLALALAGVTCLAASRSRIAIVFLAGSICVKYISAILAALALFQALFAFEATLRKRLVTSWSAIGVSTIMLLYLPFVSGAQSPHDFVAGLSFDLNPMPNFIGTAVVGMIDWTLRLSGLDVLVSGRTVINGGFAAALAAAMTFVTRPGSTLTNVFLAYGALSFIYAFIVFAGSFPWYLASPIAGVSLGGPSRTALFFTGMVLMVAFQLMLAYVAIGPIAAFTAP